MKVLYYMAVGKPRASALFLPLRRENDTLVLMKDPERCASEGVAVVKHNIGPGQRFRDPADWEVKAARVEVE